MKSRSAHTIVFMLLSIAACESGPETPAGSSCFIALPLLCDIHVAAKHVRSDDPLLAACLPYANDDKIRYYAEGSSVTTIHYADDGQIERFSSECSQDGHYQTIETTTERDADGRIIAWTMPLVAAVVT